MPDKVRQYVAIDAKSFYASVDCVERHMNPLTTNLVVADESRTEKTICLAVSPSLKAHGVPGRPRLFEVVQRVKEVNRERLNAGIRSGAIKRNPTQGSISLPPPPSMRKRLTPTPRWSSPISLPRPA